MKTGKNEKDFKIKWVDAKIPKEDFYIFDKCSKFLYRPGCRGVGSSNNSGSSCSGGVAAAACGIPYGSI